MAIDKRCRRVVNATLSLIVLAVLAGQLSAQNKNDVDAAFERATQLHQSGNLEGAVKGYEEILSTHPMRVDVRSNLGAAYSGLGRYEEAIEQYKRALALIPENQTIRFNLAMAYYKAALFSDSATELSRLLASNPQNPDPVTVKLILADCQVRLGEYKTAIDLLSPLADADPTNRTIAYLLGSALISQGDLTKGQQVIDRVFRDADSAEARLLMGSILLAADEAQNALKEFQRAIELNPKLPGIQAWYGRALMRLGDSDKAKNAFKTELTSNANDFESNLYIGVLYRQDRQTDQALAYLSKAARLRPRDQYARYHLAAAYAQDGKPEPARPLLEGVVKEHGDFTEARVLLASVYYRLNRKEDGDRENAIVQKLNAEQQAKQPGSQDGAGQSPSPKPPSNPNNTTKQPPNE
jgi:tetratricopeptide (TPR) repeat protein